MNSNNNKRSELIFYKMLFSGIRHKRVVVGLQEIKIDQQFNKYNSEKVLATEF